MCLNCIARANGICKGGGQGAGRGRKEVPGSHRVVVILGFKFCFPPGWLVVTGPACRPGHVLGDSVDRLRV